MLTKKIINKTLPSFKSESTVISKTSITTDLKVSNLATKIVIMET